MQHGFVDSSQYGDVWCVHGRRLPPTSLQTMTTQLNGQATRVKFYPGLGFAPVIDAVTKQQDNTAAAALQVQVRVTAAKA